MTKILYVASLHHPEQLQQDRHAARQAGVSEPLFPTSMRQHFWEKAFRKRGYELDVFWRNLPGYGSRDIDSLRSETYTRHITPQRVASAVMHRLPYPFNPDLRRRNSLFTHHVRQFQPDIIWMVGDNRVIHADTLAHLKQTTGCRIIYSTGTSPIVFSHALEREAAPLYDLVLVNDYYHGIQWRELGAKQMACLPVVAIDPDFHFPRDLSANERQDYACAVSFVGTLLPENLYGERVAALNALREFNPGIWSVHDLPQSLQVYGRGYALGDTMMRVLTAATISLNIHGNFMLYGGNMRLFEAAGVGAFQLTDDRPGNAAWFSEGETIVSFYDLDDLRDKVRYYLAHPDERLAIATAAREHVLKNHTYENRLDALEAILSLW